MKSDVATLQLSERRKVSFSQATLIAVVTVIATKFCTLPSVLAEAAGSKSVWVALVLVAAELVLLFFATATAKCGGLCLLPLKQPLRLPLLLFFSAFFTLKLAALAREISTYFALSLFENAPVLPIEILLLVACALVARKGFMAIGRLLEIMVWLFLFVLIFVLVFTRTEGDLFNALGMFSPDLSGMGKGILGGAAWFGDGAIVAFLDLRGESERSSRAKGEPPAPDRVKAKKKILLAAALSSVLIVVLFYAVFTSVYGDAAKMTDYAFIKLSAFKANTDELGSADWPVIILWSLLSSLYLSLLFLAAKESIAGLKRATDDPKEKPLPLFLTLAAAATAFSAFLLQEEGDYADFMTRVMTVLTMIVFAAILASGSYSLFKRKEESNEKQD